jgi:hypothetical protein
LGIEILCISSAEVGGNLGIVMFGFTTVGIVSSYLLVYGLSGFVTFAALFGRYKRMSTHNRDCSCCSVLESNSNKSFFWGVKTILRDFVYGIANILKFKGGKKMKGVFKTWLTIFLAGESICIFTVVTIDLLLYQYSLILSIPISILAGAMAVAAPLAFRETNQEVVILRLSRSSKGLSSP